MPRRLHPRSPSLLRWALCLAVLAVVSACGGGPAEAPAPNAIDRETFIATYVDLRIAAIRAGHNAVDATERARILQEHDVTEDALLSFATANGEKVDYMRQVWDEVERRLDGVPLTDDGGRP